MTQIIFICKLKTTTIFQTVFKRIHLTKKAFIKSMFFRKDDVQSEVALFEMFKDEETGLLPIGKFLSVTNFYNYSINLYQIEFL